MKTYRFALSFVVVFLVAAAVCFGGTLTVGKGGKYKNIQDAIDAAQSGDVIVIKSGTYTQADSLSISEKSGLEIRGEGSVTIACSAYVPVIYIIDSQDIAIRNIHGVHKVKDPAVGKGVCGPGATIITAENSSGITVSKCELNGCGQTGFESLSSNGIVLDGNYIHDNVNSAIALYLAEDEEPDVKIINNRLENNFGPVIVSPRDGLLKFYFKDTDEAEGVTLENNKWKNNDKMPRKTVTVNGNKIVFWGSPAAEKGANGKTVVYSGILNQDTKLPVGDTTVVFMKNSLITFYENGEVSGGFCAEEDLVTLPDETEVVLPAGGYREFWESGILKSAEVEDGSVLDFDEDGNPMDAGNYDGETDDESAYMP
jgi:parallel beta-helix repeat protein